MIYIYLSSVTIQSLNRQRNTTEIEVCLFDMFCLSLPIWYSPITPCKFLQNLSARQHLAFFERVSLSLWATRLRHKRSRLFRHTTGSV